MKRSTRIDSEIANTLMRLIQLVQHAIERGDWKVDGACDPELLLSRAAHQINVRAVVERWG